MSKTIKVVVPAGAPLYTFTPLETFEAEVCGHTNIYMTGMGYTVREGNTELHELVGEWIAAGKVK